MLLMLILLVSGCSDEQQDEPPPASDPSVMSDQPAEAPALPEELLIEEVKETAVYSLTYLASEGGRLVGPPVQQIEKGEHGSQVTAVAEEGFRFAGWSDGVTTAERVETEVTSDLMVRAIFEPVVYDLSYRVEGSGRIDGPASQQVAHGEDAAQVTAVAAANHHFTGWSDGVASAQRRDRDLKGPLEVTARFAVDQYQLNYIADDNGQISGPATQHVDHGGDGQPVTAVAADGYHFVRWSDGNTTSRRQDTGVTEDMSVTADFAVNYYSVTYAAEEHGHLKGEAEQRIKHGETAAEVEAVADAGYHFVSWSDGVTSAQRLDEDIRADLEVTAQFAVNTYVVGGVVQGLVEGSRLQIDNNDSETLEISANGPFRFSDELLDGAEYQVGVVSQPQSPNQICSLSGEQGNIDGEDVDNILIDCVLRTYSIGGTIVGLPDGDRIELQNKGEDDLLVATEGSFVFPQRMKDGSSYEVELVSPPPKPNWTCDIHNSSGLLEGKDIDNVEIDCYPQVMLEGEAGVGKVRLNWNQSDFAGVTFDLCQAREEIIGADIENCARLSGGTVRPGVSDGLVIEGLRNNQPYWFQLLARYEGGRLTYSEPVSAVPYGGLNDTGIDWCADMTVNHELSGNRQDKLSGCEAVAGSHWGQDAMFGRDRAALNRNLKKSGIGSAGFDFTRICRSGEAAGEGRCPPNPMPGKGFDNWACSRDNVTGLMWELKEDSGLRAVDHTYTWYQSDAAVNGGSVGVENGGRCSGSGCDTASYVDAINKEQLCGIKNWRLPTRKEMLSIVDNGRFNPALEEKQFPDALSEYFWTSSPYSDSSQMAWQVYFLYGEALPVEKNQARPVRLVSGDTATFAVDQSAEKICQEFIPLTSPDAVFDADSMGVATHKSSGLMWTRCSIGQKWDGQECAGEPTLLNWAEALAASAKHEFAGFEDWRLPNKNELEFIVEEACSQPAINQRVFPNTPSIFYWSSSPYAGSARGAWSVDFGYGTVSATVKTGKLPVRLVRDVEW